MTRRYDPRRAKPHLTYTALELTELFNVAIATVRKWQKDGLSPIDQVRPFLFAGGDVARFLAARNKPRQPMAPGYIYCVACKIPVRPLQDGVDIVARTHTSKDLRGNCPDCFHEIFRRVRISELREKLGNLAVWNEDA